MAAALPFLVPALVGAGTAIVGSALMKPKQEAAAPAQEKGPVVMPLADDAAVRKARQRSMMQQAARGGRDSTILTGGSDSGGEKLGA
jgi:hypothetical protein